MCLGIPGEVKELFEREGLHFANVRFGGVEREVCLEYQGDVAPGDFVLVHVGFAIAKLDAAEAARTFALLEELGQLDELGETEGETDGGEVAGEIRPDDDAAEPAA